MLSINVQDSGASAKLQEICDVLIAFYSNGYPLEKAEQYVALRRPYLINDLRMQRTLMDRRLVYDLLEESGIDVPRHVFMSRDGYVSTGTGDGPEKDDDEEGGSSICREEPEIEEYHERFPDFEINGASLTATDLALTVGSREEIERAAVQVGRFVRHRDRVKIDDAEGRVAHFLGGGVLAEASGVVAER